MTFYWLVFHVNHSQMLATEKGLTMTMDAEHSLKNVNVY